MLRRRVVSKHGGATRQKKKKKKEANRLTFVARVRVHVNGEAAGPVKAFGAVGTGVSSPTVRLLVGGDRGQAFVWAEVALGRSF